MVLEKDASGQALFQTSCAILHDADARSRMEKAMAALERDFQKLRTGRATTALVDGIKADYYGTPTPISQMASVAVPDSRGWDSRIFPACPARPGH